MAGNATVCQDIGYLELWKDLGCGEPVAGLGAILSCIVDLEWVLGPLFLGRSNPLAMKCVPMRRFTAF